PDHSDQREGERGASVRDAIQSRTNQGEPMPIPTRNRKSERRKNIFKILAHYFKKSSLLEFLVRLRQRSKCRLESAFSDSRMADMSNADEAGPAIGVIGGSGLYEIEGFAGAEEIRVETPFGDPSDT